MNREKQISVVVGLLFLIAMIASLVGGGMLESLLLGPAWPVSISENSKLLTTGIILEMVNAIAVIGIAIMMFPLFRSLNETIAVGYFGFRIIEALFCIIAAIIPQLLVSLSSEYLAPGYPGVSDLEVQGNLLIEVRSELAGLIIPLFFSLGALLFYFLIYKSKLLPGFIPVWGIAGVVLILVLNFTGIESSFGIILALPIILNEIFLGTWLIIKGFNKPEGE